MMVHKDIISQIIYSCDETLKENFLRRMEIALRSAEDMAGSRDMTIFKPEVEKAVLEHAAFGLPPELESKARSLWASLERMSREREYKYMVENLAELILPHEKDIVKEAAKGPILCPMGVERTVSSTLDEEVTVCPSTNAVLDEITRDPGTRGAIMVDSIYNIEWLYMAIYDRHIYVNEIRRAADGSVCVLMSQKLVPPKDDSLVSVVFSLPQTHGALVQAMGVFADYKVNIEFLRMRNIHHDNSYLSNLLFVDLDADLKAMPVRASLMQLQHELPFFRVFGWRKSI